VKVFFGAVPTYGDRSIDQSNKRKEKPHTANSSHGQENVSGELTILDPKKDNEKENSPTYYDQE
jgi:hypothetical protein